MIIHEHNDPRVQFSSINTSIFPPKQFSRQIENVSTKKLKTFRKKRKVEKRPEKIEMLAETQLACWFEMCLISVMVGQNFRRLISVTSRLFGTPEYAVML